MSKRNLEGRIKLTSYDELFGIGEAKDTDPSGQPAQNPDGQIVELPLDGLVAFNHHPFKVEDDEKMEETVESIKEHGVLVPIIVRPAHVGTDNGRYEILSGHRRCHASRMAAKDTIPAIIKDCPDDEATVIMVDANIQREDISIMEKAKAYRMKHDALKHQGSPGGSSLDAMSEASGDNPKTIQRLIRLSYLSDDLLKLVDEKRLGFVQGVDISFLSEPEQAEVFRIIESSNKSVSLGQAVQLKEAHKNQGLTAAKINEILDKKKRPARKISFSSKKLEPYFTSEMSDQEMEDLIIKLLAEWKEKGGET